MADLLDTCPFCRQRLISLYDERTAVEMIHPEDPPGTIPVIAHEECGVRVGYRVAEAAS